MRCLRKPNEAGESVGNQESSANGGKAGGAPRMVRMPLADQALGGSNSPHSLEKKSFWLHVTRGHRLRLWTSGSTILVVQVFLGPFG